jgi:4-amino-4-deoxy-L-arabinose transferase-like glycosyltransferase
LNKPLTRIVWALAAVKLALHLYAGRNYGYFVDELYNIALARHLDWGYVDVAPMIALLGRIELTLFGDSLSAVRFFAAVAGAALVLLTGLLARELGGGRFAQAFAALCVLLAPGIMALDHFLNVNAFEPLVWMTCALLVTRMIRTGNPRLWLWFGLAAGIGLETKHSMLIFGFALVAGVLLSPQRKLLFNRYLFFGGAIAVALLLPNLIWNIQHHFPFIEEQRNIASSGRDVRLSPGAFFGQEALAMLPLTVPIWIGGLWWLFRGPYRALAWAWIITALIILLLSPRVYYLFPAYPMLFAAGAIVFENLQVRFVKPVYATLMVLLAALLAPTLIPLLPPETYIRYAEVTHLQQPRIETHKLGPLPQLFADQFGWEEMAAAVARAYNNLPPDVRAHTAIFGQNYGQAGAIDVFGPRYGLPPAISGHQNYYLWGPRGYTGDSVIVMGDRREVLEKKFASVEFAGHVEHPYSMPYQHFDLFYCRGMKRPLAEIWPRLKAWD